MPLCTELVTSKKYVNLLFCIGVVRLNLKIVIFSLTLIFPIFSGAQPLEMFDGHQLVTLCKVDEICTSYVAGVSDAYALFALGGRAAKDAYCLPETKNLYPIGNVLKKYLDAHPEKLHLAGSMIALEALVEAFPCNH